MRAGGRGGGRKWTGREEEAEEEEEEEEEEYRVFRVPEKGNSCSITHSPFLHPTHPPLPHHPTIHVYSGDALPSELQGAPKELFLARTSHTVGRIAAPGAAVVGGGEEGKGTVPVKVHKVEEREGGVGEKEKLTRMYIIIFHHSRLFSSLVLAHISLPPSLPPSLPSPPPQVPRHYVINKAYISCMHCRFEVVEEEKGREGGKEGDEENQNRNPPNQQQDEEGGMFSHYVCAIVLLSSHLAPSSFLFAASPFALPTPPPTTPY